MSTWTKSVYQSCITQGLWPRAVAKGPVNWSGFGQTNFPALFNKVGMALHGGCGPKSLCSRMVMATFSSVTQCSMIISVIKTTPISWTKLHPFPGQTNWKLLMALQPIVSPESPSKILRCGACKTSATYIIFASSLLLQLDQLPKLCYWINFANEVATPG